MALNLMITLAETHFSYFRKYANIAFDILKYLHNNFFWAVQLMENKIYTRTQWSKWTFLCVIIIFYYFVVKLKVNFFNIVLA